MSLPPLPAHLPLLPKGYVYLGLGLTFKHLENYREFWGVDCSMNGKKWGHENAWMGTAPSVHYAAPTSSKIVRLNTPKKLKKLPTMEAHVYAKPKKKAKRVKGVYRFVVTVKTDSTYRRAISALLCAFASRQPDGCEFTVKGYRAAMRRAKKST